MSATEPVSAFYLAVARGDIDGVLATLHSDLAWTEAEGFPYFSGTWRTPQEVVEKLLIPLGRDWDNFSATPFEFIEEDNCVVVFGVYSGVAKATGKSMRATFAHRWSVLNGKIIRFDMFADTALIQAALQP